jgi:RimJ/RimL family protein N-acetyltransferase
MQEANSYFLKSKRLGFRCWAEADLPLALALWGDPQVGRFIGGPFSAQKVKERLAEHIAMKIAHNIQYWPVFLLAGDEFVGCAGLRPYQPEKKIYELGAHLLPAYWGQGFASEASQAIIDLAFSTLGAQGLIAGHHPNNAASRKLLPKLGFRYVGEEFYAPTDMVEPTYILESPTR